MHAGHGMQNLLLDPETKASFVSSHRTQIIHRYFFHIWQSQLIKYPPRYSRGDRNTNWTFDLTRKWQFYVKCLEVHRLAIDSSDFFQIKIICWSDFFRSVSIIFLKLFFYYPYNFLDCRCDHPKWTFMVAGLLGSNEKSCSTYSWMYWQIAADSEIKVLCWFFTKTHRYEQQIQVPKHEQYAATYTIYASKSYESTKHHISRVTFFLLENRTFSLRRLWETGATQCL